jgi:hypothetical protein
MMKFRFVSMAAAAALIGGPASADPFLDAVVKNFQDLGYQFVEVDRTRTRLEVEGVRGTEKLEVVYDLATGRILSQETGTADSRDIGRTGVRIDGTTGAATGGAAPVSVDPTRTGDGFADNVIADFRARGYDFIEIERGATQLKAEGIRGTEELEIVYDLATGRIIKQETSRADAEYIGRTGIEFDVSNASFVGDDDDDDDRSGRDRDDDDDDDDRSGRDRDDDDDDDDRSGRDRDDDDDDDRSGSGSDRDDDDRDDDSGSDDNDSDDDSGSDDNDDDDDDDNDDD